MWVDYGPASDQGRRDQVASEHGRFVREARALSQNWLVTLPRAAWLSRDA